MVKRRDTQPATKADLKEGLRGLDSKIDALKGELTGMKGELTGMKGDSVTMKGDIRRLMIASVDTNEHMRSMEDRLNKRMDARDTLITDKLETFAARMETIWRESIVFPRILDEQGATMRGHEARITALEARRSP